MVTMILWRRAFRRLAPLICCLILLRVYIVKEGGGAYPDEGQLRRPQLGEALFEEVGRRLSKENERHLGEASSSSTSAKSQPHELPLRLMNTESTLLTKDRDLIDVRINISGAVRDERPIDVTQIWPQPVWLRITDDLYTYSAFWDYRPGLPAGPVVRVVGMLRYRRELVENVGYRWTGVVKDHMMNSSCYLWYRDHEEPEEGILKAFIFEEGLKIFVGTYFLCHPKAFGPVSSEGNSSSTSGSSDTQGSSNQLLPYAVSILPRDVVSAPHRLIYLSETPSSGFTVNSNTSVCVRPLHGPYSDLQAITQFLAYYHTVLGVSHFYFYDLAVNVKVKELFVALGGEIVIQVLPWNLPTTKWEELWDLGSLAALNDCVYRSLGRHRYVAIVDLDEFIVPRAPAAGLAQLYHSVLKHKNGQEGDAALILNAFFCYDFKDNVDAYNYTFPIFRYTRREARLWPPKSRSKMILAPEYIVSVGHHMVHNFLLNTSKNCGSPKHLSVLHHYRACADLRLGVHAKGSLVLDQETMKDMAMMKYKRTVFNSRIVKLYRNYLGRHPHD